MCIVLNCAASKLKHFKEIMVNSNLGFISVALAIGFINYVEIVLTKAIMRSWGHC